MKKFRSAAKNHGGKFLKFISKYLDFSKLIFYIMSAFVFFIKSKTTAQQQDTIKSIVSVAVYAAQQMFTKGDAVAKKAYALQQIKAVLEQWHIEGVLNGHKNKPCRR